MPQRTEQLQLLHDAPENEFPLSGGRLFSTNYLEKHFRYAEGFPTPEEVQPLYEAAKTRWQDNLHGLRRQKEAFTRTHFIEPLLADLDWHFIPEADLPKGPTRKRPDCCLFNTAEAQQQAAAQSQAVEVFAYATTVLEAKQWNHPLDRESGKDTPGWFPSEQIQDYIIAHK